MAEDPQDRLAKALSEQTLEKEQKKQILTSLNKALGKPDLYTEKAFSDPNLSEKGAGLFDRDPNTWTDAEVGFLNRELLVSAWPNVIAPSVRLQLPPGFRQQSPVRPCLRQSDRHQSRTEPLRVAARDPAALGRSL